MPGEWNVALTIDQHAFIPAGVVSAPPHPYLSDWLRIVPGADGGDVAAMLTVYAGYAYDGTPQDGTTIACAFHDALYQFCDGADSIADAWGWTPGDVIAWANEVFSWVMERDGANPILREAYYLAVRECGQTYHEAKRVGWRRTLLNLVGDRLATERPPRLMDDDELGGWQNGGRA